MNTFRAYWLPLLATLPVAVVLGLLWSFLLPQVRGDTLRLLLFVIMCLSSIVVAAFVLNYLPDYTLEDKADEKARDESEVKL